MRSSRLFLDGTGGLYRNKNLVIGLLLLFSALGILNTSRLYSPIIGGLESQSENDNSGFAHLASQRLVYALSAHLPEGRTLYDNAENFTGPRIYFKDKSLIIWGAAIASSMIHANASALHIWVQNRDFMDRGERIFWKKGLLEQANVLSFSDTIHLQMELWQNENSKSLCTFVENANIDYLPRAFLLRFECLLDEKAVDMKNKDEKINLKLVRDSEDTVQFSISPKRGCVGAGCARNEFDVARDDLAKVNLTLCLAGTESNAIRYLKEFVYYHLRIGVDRIIISLHGGSSKSAGRVLMRRAYAELEYWIKLGVVILVKMEPPDFAEYIHRDGLKLVFYEQCLYWTKSVSEYVGIWDIDEYLVPTNVSKGSIMPMLQSVVPHDSCKDWCFVTFPSYSIFKPLEEQKVSLRVKGSIAENFPIRSISNNFIWQKSIARTKNAFNAGFHLFGSCLFNGEHGNITAAYHRDLTCSQRAPRLGAIHHFLGIFYGLPEKSDKFVPPFVTDEYSKFAIDLANDRTVTVKSWNGRMFEVETM